MDINAQLDGIKATLLDQMRLEAKNAFDTSMTSYAEQLKSLETLATKEELQRIKSFAEEIKTGLEKLDAKHSKESKAGLGRSFNETLAETINENADKLKGLRTGFGSLTLDMKAVGDMNMTANFPGGAPFTTETRQAPVISPYERLWLSDILPSGSTSAASITYPQDNGGEGAFAVWKETDAVDKPQVDYDLKAITVAIDWIAGYLIADRSMLDDLPWLTAFLQNKMLISLKTAENSFILNKATSGLLAQATAYNGSYTNNVDKIIDAAYGQIVEDTFDMYSPSHAIMRPRKAVQLGLNKAVTAGVYDLPQGSVGFANGRLSIGGLSTIPTSSIGADQFLALDATATQYIRRMAPELRIIEDATLAKRNKVMFRLEQRAALAVYAPKALVKGTFTAATT